MNKQSLDLPSLPREITNSIAEHEVLLSFNNDETAEVFTNWWYSEGQGRFAIYLNEYLRNGE